MTTEPWPVYSQELPPGYTTDHWPEMPLSNNGWLCPKCKSVYAPFVRECAKCNGDKK